MGTCPVCRTIYDHNVRLCPNDGAVLEEQSTQDPRVGQILERKYRLDSQLGQGGMGTVYRATHLMLGKACAVKLIKPELGASRNILRRFRAEARAAAALNHPNIVPVFDLGQTPDGALYFAMDLVEGPTLRDVISSSRQLDPPRILRLLRQVTSALSLAHARKIIHRDLKPQNIALATDADGGELPKLLDFGIAKSFDEDNTSYTKTGFAIGTPQYMSPEQAENAAVDARSDLYSMGVILYEMLTGVVPFTGSSAAAIFAKQKSEVPIPPSRRRPDLNVPPALEAIALRCLEKDPANRFQTAGELAGALDVVAESQGVAAPLPMSGAANGGPPNDVRPTRRTRVAIAILAGAGVALFVVAALVNRPGGALPGPNRSPTTDRGPRSDTRPAGMTRLAPAALPAGSAAAEDGLWIAKTEVTNADFARFLETRLQWRREALSPARHDGDYLKLWTTAGMPPTLQAHPVVYVTKEAAEAYCQADGLRLPTEQEWEYAARAKTQTAYWWGDTFDPSHANGASGGTQAVGQPEHVNGFGLADMAGNVWEWTSSREGSRWVVRGGSWKDGPTFLTSSSRMLITAETTGPDLGFRCVR